VGVGYGVEVGADVLVVDTYDADERMRCATASGPAVRVMVDDLGGAVPAGFDAVWNPNAYGSAALYPGCAGIIIAGEDAIPLREGLPVWSGSGLPNVGVTLGGGGPGPVLRAALAGLARAAAAGTFVGSGDWAPADWGRTDVEMPWRSLAECGRLVTAGGSTAWEAAAVRIPAVVVTTADNQVLVERWVAARGVPTVDARRFTDPDVLGSELRAALERATPLPALASGAEAVAQTLANLARRRRAMQDREENVP
jgi:hypothetical protein